MKKSYGEKIQIKVFKILCIVAFLKFKVWFSYYAKQEIGWEFVFVHDHNEARGHA